MNTLHLVDPELANSINGIHTLAPTYDSLPKLRVSLAEFQSSAPDAPGVVMEERFTFRPDGSKLRLLVYLPADTIRKGGLLWFHGGGMIMGTPDQYDAQSRFFSYKFNCVVVAVDFRLAPEAPYPAGLDDCYYALQWLHQNAIALNIPLERIAVAGESGGGNLATALTLYAREKGGPAISAQFLQYPMLDDRTGTSYEVKPLPNVGEFLWQAASNRFAWECVLGHLPGAIIPRGFAAPARVEDLSNLPETYIYVGDLDLFLGECLRYVQNLLKNGVLTELHLYRGAYHGFMSFSKGTKLTIRAEVDFWGAMERHFCEEKKITTNR
jgi:acetyl esterase/lipase